MIKEAFTIMDGLVFSIVFGSLAGFIIFGAICRSIVSSKQYPNERNHGFAWGFWLGFIGLIVCACKPNYFDTAEGRRETVSVNNPDLMQPATKSVTSPKDEKFEWVCSNCQTVNRVNKNHCFKCGSERTTSITYLNDAGRNDVKEESNNVSMTNDGIKESLLIFKEMLDDGLITEEEFTAKKKQLLGL